MHGRPGLRWTTYLAVQILAPTASDNLLKLITVLFLGVPGPHLTVLLALVLCCCCKVTHAGPILQLLLHLFFPHEGSAWGILCCWTCLFLEVCHYSVSLSTQEQSSQGADLSVLWQLR